MADAQMRLALEQAVVQAVERMATHRGNVDVSLLFFDQVNIAWKSTLSDEGFASMSIGALETYDEHGAFISIVDTEPTFDPRPFLPAPRQEVIWAVFLSRRERLVGYLSTADRAGVVEALRLLGDVARKDETE